MNNSYSDIRKRISEDPRWWDEYAVPRYGAFAPGKQANIYAREMVLMEIECQGCGEIFHVCMAFAQIVFHNGEASEHLWMTPERINELHYGDPPNIGCCDAGPTMNSIPRQVLEFWRKADMEWERVPELEIGIECEWADG